MTPDSPQLGKMVLFLGILLVLVGLLLLSGKGIPILGKLGKLPGDIRIEREGFSFYFPLSSCILLSALLTLISFAYRFFSKN